MTHPLEAITESSPEPRTGRAHWVMYVLLVISLSYFTWRSVPRAIYSSQDLTVGYSAAQALVAGEDPYDHLVLQRLLAYHSGPADGERLLQRLRNVYFPPTLAVFLPLAPFPWPAAKAIWLTLNIAGVGVICWGLLRYASLSPASNRGLALLALVIALSPIHTTIAMGQTAVLSVAAIVLAMVMEKSGRHRLAGLAYGLATAIKIQIGLPFIAYLLWRRRWQASMSAISLLLAFTCAATVALELGGSPWFQSWRANAAELFKPGGLNDPTLANPNRHSMIGLPVLLHTVIDSSLVVSSITYSLVVAAGLYAMYHIRGRYPPPHRELLSLSIVAVLSLLVTYHRTYDGVLLVLPVLWAFVAEGRSRWIVLLAALAWVVPLQTLAYQRWEMATSLQTCTIIADVVVLCWMARTTLSGDQERIRSVRCNISNAV